MFQPLAQTYDLRGLEDVGDADEHGDSQLNGVRIRVAR
jgi:hypothetical protein